MMMIIFILTASYIWDDVRIVYALAIYDAIFFGDGPTDKGILGVGYESSSANLAGSIPLSPQ